ncbi:hypothetical protein SO802_011441 [Lithocarpus litseifolius]|uniref:Uncharacterized protein n=1 Tax=Lithocarpus litseifolius TaxID=425828 RepID=A0AAW2D442_9ROSI
MNQILTQEGRSLRGEHGEGILWSKNDVFAQVMGAERCGRLRGVGFGPTPSGRSGSNLSCYTLTSSSSSETTHRITELETSLASVMDQLSRSEERHQENLAQALAQSDAWHEEQLTEALAQSDAKHQEQLIEALAKALAQSNAKHQEQLIEALTQSNAKHQEKMTEMMLHMKEMFAQFSPLMHSSLPSQDSTASK